jgi:hypothetical protein
VISYLLMPPLEQVEQQIGGGFADREHVRADDCDLRALDESLRATG